MNNSNSIPLWDTNLFHLGKLCDRAHNYCGTGQSLRFDVPSAIFALRMRSLEKKISNTVVALEYDLELAHQDTILFAKRLRFRDQDLSYSRSAKGRHRAYKRRLLAPQVSKSYSDEDLWQRLVIFDGRCAYCRQFVYNHHLMTWDHFHCLSNGGSDTLKNLVPCCKLCNSSKRDAEPLTWFQKQLFFDKDVWSKITTHTN